MTRLLLLALPLALLACGGDAEPVPTDAPASAPTAVPTSTASEAPTDPEPMPDSTEAFVLPSLTPATMNYEEPIAVDALRDVIVAPYGKDVVVYGYVHGTPSSVNGKARMGRFLGLAAEAGQGGDEAKLLTCDLGTRPDPSRVEPDAVVVLRGRVDSPTSGTMRLEDGCEIVSVGESPPEGAVSVQDLHGAMFGWVGTGVRVVGHYNGTTTSQLPSGAKTTIGLAPDGTTRAPQAVVCVMAGDVPETLATDRDGVVVSGIVTDNWKLTHDPSSGTSVIELGDCTVVNR
jgi:hypothetical protein